MTRRTFAPRLSAVALIRPRRSATRRRAGARSERCRSSAAKFPRKYPCGARPPAQELAERLDKLEPHERAQVVQAQDRAPSARGWKIETDRLAERVVVAHHVLVFVHEEPDEDEIRVVDGSESPDHGEVLIGAVGRDREVLHLDCSARRPPAELRLEQARPGTVGVHPLGAGEGIPRHEDAERARAGRHRILRPGEAERVRGHAVVIALPAQPGLPGGLQAPAEHGVRLEGFALSPSRFGHFLGRHQAHDQLSRHEEREAGGTAGGERRKRSNCAQLSEPPAQQIFAEADHCSRTTAPTTVSRAAATVPMSARRNPCSSPRGTRRRISG